MEKIRNFKALATTPLREHILRILEAGLLAIDTKEAVSRGVQYKENSLIIRGRDFPIGKGRLFVVCIGKCALDAAHALEDILGDRIFQGIAVDVRTDTTLTRFESSEGDHPFPTNRNIDSTKKIINLLHGVSRDDTVLFIISGGGSTLLCQPENFTCQDERDILDSLFRAGANIVEINTIRKHLSLARGGFLAQHAYPAQVISLIFSDVVGDDLQFIASGPTVKDDTTVEEAKAALTRYNIFDRCKFKSEHLFETPKEEKYFTRVSNILLVSNEVALSAMRLEAERFGYQTKICSNCLTGEARVVGENILKEIESASPNTALLYGGETVVFAKGGGAGGRNQELVLSALSKISSPDIVVASCASDGRDNSENAGALCDILFREKAEERKVSPSDALSRNDSLTFWNMLEGGIVTGVLGSNVSDLVVALRGGREKSIEP